MREAIEEIVRSGFLGAPMRANDERGHWAGSAGRRSRAGAERLTRHG
ncbi:hypothetical protein [Kitasatospora sp. NPDC097691]